LEFENLSSLHLQVPSKFDYSQMNHSWRLTSCGSPHYDLSGWKCKVIFGINNVKVLKIHANTDLTILFFFHWYDIQNPYRIFDLTNETHLDKFVDLNLNLWDASRIKAMLCLFYKFDPIYYW
jgi:hypothetical protein